MAALQGLRVLDLTRTVAGSYCTRLLAGLGAEVVKVEPPDGDPIRLIGPTPREGGDGALFLFLNQGKQSVTLDLARSTDRARLNALLCQADVLVETFTSSEGTMLGLDYRELSGLNPGLIATSVTPFGRDGPYHDYRGPEIAICALGGLLALSGEPDREPLQPPGWQTSYLTGTAAALAIMCALWYRQRTGLGQQVEVAAMEVVASCLEGLPAAASAGEGVLGRRGNRRGYANPLLLLPCRDGHVVLAIASEADWETFSYWVGDERLRAPRLTTPAGREAHAAELDAILVGWLRKVTRDQFFAEAQARRFPCCPVIGPGELVGDPQHRARSFFTAVKHPVAGVLVYPGPPFRLPAGPWSDGRAPLLGEHNRGIDALWRDRAITSAAVHDGKPRHGGVATGIGSPGDGAGALAGVRILDMTSMWAGPLCTRLLADAGAEVIKVELETRPDGTRMGPTATTQADGDYAALFGELNRNKLGVTLDLRQQKDRRRFLDLVAHCDALVENFSPRVMRNLNLEYAALRAVRPDLVMLSMPAFGTGGPQENGVAFGSGLEAISGLAALSGYLDGGPMLQGVAFGDPVAGLHGAVALLAALEHRCHTGQGQHVELAQREALTQHLGEVIVGMGLTGSAPERTANDHPLMAPHGCFRCLGEDRWIAIAVADDEQWGRLCQVLGRPELAVDSRYAGASGRRLRRANLKAIITAWTSARDSRVAMETLQAAGVPAGIVLDPASLCRDPHLKERGFWADRTEAGDRDKRMYPGPLFRLSASPLRVRHPAPSLGQDNEAVFATL